MNTSSRLALALMIGMLPAAALANGGWSDGDRCDPVGTWSVNVTFPPESGIPPFTELLSILPGGVVLETNSQLHPNSANSFLPFNGSPGHGAWVGRSNCRIKYKILKQVFDPTQLLLGFVRITVRAKINGNTISNEVADSNVELVFGTDPDAPPVMVFGGSSSQGKRVSVN